MATRLEKIAKLKETMDDRFQKAAVAFEVAIARRDVDFFWQLWSETTEAAYHDGLELSEKDAKKTKAVAR